MNWELGRQKCTKEWCNGEGEVGWEDMEVEGRKLKVVRHKEKGEKMDRNNIDKLLEKKNRWKD